MIFVTVGNQRKSFSRFLRAVDALVQNGFFAGEPVFMQRGHSGDFSSEVCEVRDFLPREEFVRALAEADIVISQGGAATVLQIVRMGRVPVIMPRREKYDEHVNDHQMEIVRYLASEKRIIPAYEASDLPWAVQEARRRPRQETPFEPPGMKETVSTAIEELLRVRA